MLLAFPLLVGGAALLVGFFHYSRVLDQKVLAGLQPPVIQVYSRPARFQVGATLSAGQIESVLKRAGYSPVQETDQDFYIRRGDRIYIRNREAIGQDDAGEAEILLENNRVRRITDKTGRSLAVFRARPEPIANLASKERTRVKHVSFNELPRHLINAVLAAEDKNFFSHAGVDAFGIMRAALRNTKDDESLQGGSTLTQQFVKNALLIPDRTWGRKIEEAFLSILLERRFSKEKIFELYSNEIYLGQAGSFSIIGFGEAAAIFFHKHVRDLTLAESASLAGIIPSPNRLNPHKYPDRVRHQRNLVLDAMERNGFISASQKIRAKDEPMNLKSRTLMNYSQAPYFVDYIQKQLEDLYGERSLQNRAMKVYTTVDMGLQQAAYEAMREGIAEVDRTLARSRRKIPPGTVQAALVAIDPQSGEVLAMVGGRSYGASQFDRATMAKRQPGSVFKPFAYAAALETAFDEGVETPVTIASTFLDEPTTFQVQNISYSPRNYGDKYFGVVNLRQALSRSLNVTTVKIAEAAGFDRVNQLARAAGMQGAQAFMSAALGTFEVSPLQMAASYTIFANQGKYLAPFSVMRIVPDKGPSIVYTPDRPRDVLHRETAFLVTSLMQSVINNGTAAGARSRGFTLPAAGKTGTSHDGWFAGYTPDLICVVWVGFDDYSELDLEGAQSALPIWTAFMKKAQVIYPLSGRGFEIPQGISSVDIDPSSGLLATPRCSKITAEFFIAGTEPRDTCPGNEFDILFGVPPENGATSKR